MEKPTILHMFTPMSHMSPFDINMACDAGYQVVVPHTNVQLEEVAALTQDAIFSRGPKGAKRTGIFIGGRDNALAADMFDAACKAMVPPFEVSVLVDPSGAFTTAAAMVACVERQLNKSHAGGFDGKRIALFGGTGPVGAAAAVLTAQAGARVALVARDSLERARLAAAALAKRYGVQIEVADATHPSARAALLGEVEIALATAKAGAQVLSAQDLTHAGRLRVAADVNAVPPAGIQGLGPMDEGVALGAGGALGIGALAIGNIKYQTEKSLFEAMLQTDKPRYLNMRDALHMARKHAGLA